MVSKFIINGKVLEELIVPHQERTGEEGFYSIPGILSYDGKVVQFLACKNMGLRMAKVKPITSEKALFRAKDFQSVFRLRRDQDYIVVIGSDSIKIYHTPDRDYDKVLVEIPGVNLL